MPVSRELRSALFGKKTKTKNEQSMKHVQNTVDIILYGPPVIFFCNYTEKMNEHSHILTRSDVPS